MSDVEGGGQGSGVIGYGSEVMLLDGGRGLGVGGGRGFVGGAERGEFGRAAEEGVFREAEPAGEVIDALGVFERERGEAGGAVAVNPTHVLRALARGLHECAQEILVGGREIHGAEFLW